MLEPRWSKRPSVGDSGGKKFGPATVLDDERNHGRYGVRQWVRGCRRLKERRIERARAWEREQNRVASGYLASLVLKHWRRAANHLRLWRFLLGRTGLLRGWLSWLDWLERARRFGRLGLNVGWRLRKFWPLGRFFDRWYRSVQKIIKRDFLMRLLKRWIFSLLSSAFRKWVATTEALRRAAERMFDAFRRWQRRGDLGSALWRWKRTTLFLRVCDKARRRWIFAHIARAFCKWRYFSLKMRSKNERLRDLIAALLRFLRLQGLKRAFRKWTLLPRPRRVSIPRRGQCSCVTSMQKKKCRCKFDDHLKWRIQSLRKNIDNALLSDAPKPSNSDLCLLSEPSHHAKHSAHLLAWNDKRKAMNAVNVARAPRHPIRTPIVEQMSLDNYRGRLSKDTLIRRLEDNSSSLRGNNNNLSRW